MVSIRISHKHGYSCEQILSGYLHRQPKIHR
jgi:hypothetical protein